MDFLEGNILVTMCICVARCCSVAGLVELSALAILTPVAGRVPVSHSAHSVRTISLAGLAVLSTASRRRELRAESGQVGNTRKNRPGNGDAAESRDSPIDLRVDGLLLLSIAMCEVSSAIGIG